MTEQPFGPPFRADHVGSLLRPPELKQAFRSFRDGEITAEAFLDIQDKCIRDVVALQEEAGLQSITDGEFRRASYWAHFVEKVDGFAVKSALFTFGDADEQSQEFLAPHVTDKVRRTQSISGDELDFLRGATRQTPKLTLPSPPTMHFWRGREGVEREAYEDLDMFFTDLAAVYREEIDDLVSRGARYIQIDEVPLAMLCDDGVREKLESTGEDSSQLITKYVELINASLRGRPSTLRVAMHLCRGNLKGKWLSEGGYEAIAERLFNEIEVDAFFLEYDTSRAGDFAPLRFVPQDKTVVLGLISTKTPELESVDALCKRIDEASGFLPLEQLAVSPQCGFASTVAGNPVSVDDEMAKLGLVTRVAGKVWGET